MFIFWLNHFLEQLPKTYKIDKNRGCELLLRVQDANLFHLLND